MKRQNLLNSLVLLLIFITAFYGRNVLYQIWPLKFDSTVLNILYYYAWWLLPVVIGTGLLLGFKNTCSHLGLQKKPLKGFLFSVLCTLPMFIGYAIFGTFQDNLNTVQLLHSTVFAGIGEEILFRGFLFGLLFTQFGWGFIPAACIASFFFGLGHIYQGHEIGAVLGIFLITAIGSAWFSWLYIEWRQNLWIPIFMHTLMNLSWAMFDIGENALGGLYANIFRALTIATTILITLKVFKPRGLMIKRKKLWKSNINATN